MSGKQWWTVLKRAWAESNNDNIGLIAAGTAFYAFAAIVPTLAATVLLYGLIADAATVSSNINSLFETLPADVARLIAEQLATVVQTSSGAQGLGLVLALGIALYGGTKGTGTIITALNIAYEEKEKRGFIQVNLLALALVVGAIALIFVAVGSTGLLTFLGTLIPNAPAFVIGGLRIVGYLVLGALVVTAAALLYRYAPSRAQPKWSWASPGAVGATVLWLAGTTGFGIYVANFGNYGATYGSLGAVIVFLTWLWLSAYVFLMGAEVNAELEHSTIHDTTTGPDRPMGQRGAFVADTLAVDNPKSEVADQPLGDGGKPDAKQVVGPGMVTTAVQVKTASRLTGAKLALPSALLTGSGLAMLRRGSRAGFGMVALAAAIAWFGRTSDEPEDGSTSPGDGPNNQQPIGQENA